MRENLFQCKQNAKYNHPRNLQCNDFFFLGIHVKSNLKSILAGSGSPEIIDLS